MYVPWMVGVLGLMQGLTTPSASLLLVHSHPGCLLIHIFVIREHECLSEERREEREEERRGAYVCVFVCVVVAFVFVCERWSCDVIPATLRNGWCVLHRWLSYFFSFLSRETGVKPVHKALNVLSAGVLRVCFPNINLHKQ